MNQDFLEIIPGQNQRDDVVQLYAEQHQQQRQEIINDVCHGDEIPQHPANPPVEDFLPGHRTGCAT